MIDQKYGSWKIGGKGLGVWNMGKLRRIALKAYMKNWA
jgi:hypothetical protein